MFASCSKIVREGNAVKSVRRSDQMRKRKFVETMSLQAQKAAVRRNIRARLRSVLPAEVARQSAIVAATVLQSPQYAVAKSISVYIAKEGAAEVDTRLIIADALRTSRTCYIPRCISRTRMQMVRLASLEDLDNLPVNKMGIKEPELDENRLLALDGPEAPIDLIIMPGLAFDSNGWRIGHGAGYYDRFLKECEEFNAVNGRQPTPTLALALLEQFVEGDIPRDENDKRPDSIFSAATK